MDNSGQILNEHGHLCPVLRAFANVAHETTAGSVIAAVTGKRIRVLGLVMHPGGTATSCTFNSASTAISAAFAAAANTPTILPPKDHGWFETKAGEALTITTGTGSTTGIQVIYALT